ncbi:MAG TPA: 16S rRNA (guanine(966)-N(2))-methyltransferase RsmD [Pseudomonadales bacterium]
MNQRKSPAQSGLPAVPGRFRIIGGKHRGRKLAFPAVAGLRPTPDRVRETLFNWLAGELAGARCADLFCGSGALGLEALSRGAADCVFVDGNRHALSAISEHLQTLGLNGRVLAAHLPLLPAGLGQGFDLVFLDPPYADDCLAACVQALLDGHCLNRGAWLYCENAAGQPLPQLPAVLQLHRHKTAGAVQYALYRLQPDGG